MNTYALRVWSIGPADTPPDAQLEKLQRSSHLSLRHGSDFAATRKLSATGQLSNVSLNSSSEVSWTASGEVDIRLQHMENVSRSRCRRVNGQETRSFPSDTVNHARIAKCRSQPVPSTCVIVILRLRSS